MIPNNVSRVSGSLQNFERNNERNWQGRCKSRSVNVVEKVLNFDKLLKNFWDKNKNKIKKYFFSIAET